MNVGTPRSKNVLNIGAGMLPIVPSDIDATRVYNYDPLSAAKEKLDSIAFGVFMGLIHDRNSGVLYTTEEEEIRDWIQPNSLDLIISISPYGFSVMNNWVNERLRVGGQLLVFGNHSNKWVTQDTKLFSNGTRAQYNPVPTLGGWERSVEAKVMDCYPSQTSAAERDTALNTVRNFVKMNPV